MDLAKRVQKSEVFANLNKEDIEAILKALEAGNEEVTEEVTSILDQEGAIHELFDKSIEDLTEHMVSVVTKRVESLEERKKATEEEASDRMHESEEAEHELEIFKLSSK